MTVDVPAPLAVNVIARQGHPRARSEIEHAAATRGMLVIRIDDLYFLRPGTNALRGLLREHPVPAIPHMPAASLMFVPLLDNNDARAVPIVVLAMPVAHMHDLALGGDVMLLDDRLLIVSRHGHMRAIATGEHNCSHRRDDQTRGMTESHGILPGVPGGSRRRVAMLAIPVHRLDGFNGIGDASLRPPFLEFSTRLRRVR